MDYFDVHPSKVNRRNNLLVQLKQLRKAERKARKALKAERMAELLIEKERQRLLEQQFRETCEKNMLKKSEKFEIRDQFNWDDFENEYEDEEEEKA